MNTKSYTPLAASRGIFSIFGYLFIMLFSQGLCSCKPNPTPSSAYLLVGTYTGTGALELKSDIAAENPSYLAVSPDGQFVYAVHENNPNGEVSAYAFDTVKGTLRFLNKQSTGGGSPCYIALDAKGTTAVVANYSGGNLAVLPIEKNGQLAPATQVITHRGKSVVASRQEAPHVHTAVFSPDGSRVLVTDLGTDELYSYRVVPTPNGITLDTNALVIKTTPGAGPRHVVFHPRLPVWYVMEELSGQVSMYGFDKDSVRLISSWLNDTINPPGQRGSADIHLSPDGRFLYASNRFEANNIGWYNVEAASGRLTPMGYIPTGGRKPRNFTLSPDGRFMGVANQESNTVTWFSRDNSTGKLTPLPDRTLALPKPVCLVWKW
jgi:6-phosphogluconolactonase